jgi:hypothetical protein
LSVKPPAQEPVVGRREDGDAELIRASVLSPGLEVARDAYEYDGYGNLAAFFDEMAASWRGWSGERSY